MKNNKFVIILAGLLILAVIAFSVKSMLSSPVPVDDASVQDASDGGEVLLSWGRFNYVPEVITAKKGVPLRIRADLNRLTGCYQSFVVPDLGVSKVFTEDSDVVEFTPEQAGTFVFTCQMGMGKGKLVVQ